VTNPLLVDGYAFDFGVYVLITSLDPVRMYRWKGDILLRFCSEPYHPFDQDNQDKFIPQKNQIPFWDPVENFTERYGFTAQEALNQILKNQNYDVEKFWHLIDDAIVSVTLSKVEQIIRYVNLFQKMHNRGVGGLFELLRFDFIIDDQMRPRLMEINMSPTTSPTNKEDKRLQTVYDQLIYNTISILGLTRRNSLEAICAGNDMACLRFLHQNLTNLDESLMLSAPFNIALGYKNCLNCVECCDEPACKLCLPCLHGEMILHLMNSYREHQRKGDMKRLFPTKDFVKPALMRKVSEYNHLSLHWFKEKCEQDKDWC